MNPVLHPRPPELAVFQPLGEQAHAGTDPEDQLHPVRALGAEDIDGAAERIGPIPSRTSAAIPRRDPILRALPGAVGCVAGSAQRSSDRPRAEDADALCCRHGIEGVKARALLVKAASRPGGLHNFAILIAIAEKLSEGSPLAYTALAQAAKITGVQQMTATVPFHRLRQTLSPIQPAPAWEASAADPCAAIRAVPSS